MADKLPYLKLYIGDLKKENSYRCLTLESRGVWLEMLFIMHDSSPRGYVFLEEQQLANTIGISVKKLRFCLQEMESVKTFSRDENGVIFNRRMVREGQVSEVRSVAGVKGGSVPKNRPGFVYLINNPASGHTKIGISGDPLKRLKSIVVKERGCELLATAEVSDMASQEAILHARYKRFNVVGEWFDLPADSLSVLLRSFELKSLELSIAKSTANGQQNCGNDNDNESTLKTTTEKSKTSLEEEILLTAYRIHERHPPVRRCGIGEVQDKLRAIIRKVKVAEKIEVLRFVDSQHEAWCGTDKWTEEGGQYAKGLDNWLAPSLRRWENAPPNPAEERGYAKSKLEKIMDSIHIEGGESDY